MAPLVDEKVEQELQQHPLGAVMFTTVVNGIAKVNEANETLLESDDRTKVADIDRILKEGKHDGKELPKDIVANYKKVEAAKKALKDAQEKARNAVRTEILGEEEKSDPDPELKDSAVDARNLVMEALKFLVTLGETSNRPDFKEWAEKVSVPQVGRKGSSSAGGTKPRVYVKVNGNVYGSFTEAAAGLSTKDNKVTSSEIREAWESNGAQEGAFKFGENEVVITKKEKKSDKK